MKYGYCTGFSTDPHFQVGLDLLPMIQKQGFDYVEFPMMNFSGLSDAEFSKIVDAVRANSLESLVACNFFPGSVRLVGKELDTERIATYLDEILPKVAKIGIGKIILGSGPARTFGPDQTRDEAFAQFADVLKNVILPRTKKYGILVCIEPFERNYCNLIISVLEGLELVETVNDPGLELMVDLYHMLSNGEPFDEIRQSFPHIKHVHIAGPDRRVPEDTDSYIFKALRILSELGYDGTVSFETELPKSEEHMRHIFSMTRDIMGGR